jgi:hypothetical protein
MDYPFEHTDFEGRSLALRTSGFFAAARLVVDGAEVTATKGKFALHDNQGLARELKLKASFLDPVPKVVLDGTTITLVSPLKWYEYAWMALPVVLVFTGGALGALFGMTAAYSSARIFRSDRGLVAKYMLSGLASLGAVAGFLAGATALQLLISWNTDPSSEKALKQVAEVSNRELPMMIDDQTELVKLEGLEGVLVYHYRLKTVSPGQISGESLVQRLRPTISANACAHEDSRERFLENGVALRYAYSDAQGGTIAEFDVSADDCL